MILLKEPVLRTIYVFFVYHRLYIIGQTRIILMIFQYLVFSFYHILLIQSIRSWPNSAVGRRLIQAGHQGKNPGCPWWRGAAKLCNWPHEVVGHWTLDIGL